MGMTAFGPIPWTAVNDYAVRYGYYGPDFDRLLHYVSVLDSLYLKNQNKPKSGSK